MSRKNKIIVSVLLIVTFVILRVADIRISGTQFIIAASIFFILWFIYHLNRQETNIHNSLSELNQKIENLNEDVNILQKKLRLDKVKSYISDVRIDMKIPFLFEKMRELNFDHEKEFDDFKNDICFTHVVDLISELEFMVIEGNIIPGSSSIFQCMKFKNGVLEKKYPDKPLIEISSNHLITIESKGTIEFFAFSPLVSAEKGERMLVGCFPYGHLVGKLMELYRLYFHEEIESEDRFLQMEKSLFEEEKFTQWKVTYAEDLGVTGRSYQFESNYANVYLNFTPNIDL